MSRILFALRLSTIDSKLVILEDSKIFEVKYWNAFMCQKIEIADFVDMADFDKNQNVEF